MPHEMLATAHCSVSLLYLGALYLVYGERGVSEPLRQMPEIEVNVTNDDVTETHQASCKIATEEMVADARATVTNVLTGACKAKTMDEKFASLEEKLIKELADVKWLLYNILEQHPGHLKDIRNTILYDNTSDNYPSPRQDEIDRFNNTLQNLSTTSGSTSAFVYYWQVENFDEMLANWPTSRSVRSPTFHAGSSGYTLYLKVTPKYFPDGTIFVGVGLTRGPYDSILAWPFPFRIRLEVLDQSPKGMREDRRSRIWDPATLCTENFWGRPALAGKADNPECVGLSIPRRVVLSKVSSQMSQRHLRNTKYTWNGGMLIKLVIYL
ncbi:TNF receptor-associated factor 6-like [Odontomachus brunneus]|uniref:TNF receptor-associated factor 6-like n=1 Tax=Odontomachus brunneus TaxID=486640 RepID=UPI0013F2ADED|nr:TNF receptor-associated factor 6-like [Odontomachus brunneus]